MQQISIADFYVAQALICERIYGLNIDLKLVF